MLQVHDQLHQMGVRRDLQNRVLEEVRWGVDWLLKTRFGDGYRITWARMRYYTDNKVGTVDDVIVPAEEDYAATLQEHPEWPEGTRDEAAFGTLAAAELYRATGKQIYAEQGVHFGSLLVRCQEQRFVDGIPLTGYCYTSTKRDRLVHDRHSSFEEAPVMALRTLCDTFPNHPAWIEWYSAAILHSEYFQQRGTAISAPYSLIPNSVWRRDEIDSLPGRDPEDSLRQFNDGTQLAGDCRLRVFPIWTDNLFHGNTTVQMAATASMASAALLRNGREVQDLVRLQLQWVLGGNPFRRA